MSCPLCVSSAANNEVAPCRRQVGYIRLRVPGSPSNSRNRFTSATDVPAY